jgi:hypothetical protein
MDQIIMNDHEIWKLHQEDPSVVHTFYTITGLFSSSLFFSAHSIEKELRDDSPSPEFSTLRFTAFHANKSMDRRASSLLLRSEDQVLDWNMLPSKTCQERKRKSSRRRPLKRTPWRHTFFRTTIRSTRRHNSPALLGRLRCRLGEQRRCPHRVLGGEGESSRAPAGTGSPPKGSCREQDGVLALHQPRWDLGRQRPLRRRWPLWRLWRRSRRSRHRCVFFRDHKRDVLHARGRHPA